MAGTPPTPATETWSTPSIPSVRPALMRPDPGRVSVMRLGVMPVNTWPVVVGLVPSVYQPPTSAMTSTLPEKLYIVTEPLLPTGTVTRLGTVCPATKFTLDALGRLTPAG